MTLIDHILTPWRWPLIAAAISLALLLGAYVFEHGFGYLPCPLCLDQRRIHQVIIAAGIIVSAALFWREGLRRHAWLACLAMAGLFAWSAGFAFWHAGIEYGWWEGPAGCAVGGAAGVSMGDLLDVLDGGANLVLCNEAAWTLLGISMAGYNALISAGLAAVSVLAAMRGRT